MKRIFLQFSILLVLVLHALGANAAPQGTAFTYQGRLEQSGVLASGPFDFTFRLFDAAGGSTQIGATLTRTGVAVDQGLFTVSLDFGIAAFEGSKRFLQVTVGTTVLAPRTELTSAPYANTALTSLDAGMAQSVAWYGASNHLVAPESEVTPSTASWFSVVIGADGLPIIAYYAVATLDLKVAICNDPVCSTSRSVTLDSAGDVGDFNSIAMGVQDRPVISYYDRTNGDLKFARCVDPQCSSAATSAIETLGDTGQFTSITAMNGAVAGLEGNRNGPLIAYYDNSNDDLRFLRCVDADCASPTGVAIDGTGDVGQWPAIAFDGRRVQIAYQDVTNKRLKLAVCSNSSCSGITLRTLDSAPNSGFAPSIALTPANRAVIALTRFNGTSNNEIIYVQCNGTPANATYCDTPTLTSLFNSSSAAVRMPQLLLRGDGVAPLIWDGQFQIAGCEDTSCAAFGTQSNAVAVGATLVVSRSAAALGADGLPLLLVQGGSLDGTPRGIKAMHCASPSCRTYGRER